MPSILKRLHPVLVTVLVTLAPSNANAQDLRPRAALVFGTGLDAPSCTARCENMSALSASLDIGASYQGLYWGTVKLVAYTEPDLIEQGPYIGSFLGVVGGYQLLEQVAVYGGVGRNSEQWSAENVTSNGLAVALGGEAVLGSSTGLGLRLQAEFIHSMSGSRVTRFENTKSRGDFRPRLMHVSLGVIWR